MTPEIILPFPAKEAVKARSKGQERERTQEISSILDICTLIGKQSDARLFPYTTNVPFAHVKISENDGKDWTVVQIEGIAQEDRDINPLRFANETGGFLAYKEVHRNEEPEEERPVLYIDSSWCMNSKNKIIPLEPEEVKGRTFFEWAETDRTLLDPDQLEDEFRDLQSQNTGPYEFREVRQLISIAKALTFKGDDETAERVLDHAVSTNKIAIRKKDKEDIEMIKTHRPQAEFVQDDLAM